MKVFYLNVFLYISIVRVVWNFFKINIEYYRIVKLLGDLKLS